MLDILIRGATLVDGTGAPPRRADIGVKDGKIAEVGAIASPAARVIDAAGRLVTPGFVDIHTHYDGQASWDSYLAPTCLNGVTSLAMGNCGVGFAPARPDRHDWLIARAAFGPMAGRPPTGALVAPARRGGVARANRLQPAESRAGLSTRPIAAGTG